MNTERSAADAPAEVAGVIARPPLIFVGFLALGLALDYFWPIDLPMLATDVRRAAGLALGLAGLALIALSFRQFTRAGTNVPTWKPSLAIVTDGLYRFSRNPIYVGLTAIYLGIALAAGSPWAFAMLIPTLAVMQYGVILREERYLGRRFGAAYLDYKARVRRWL